MTDLAELRESLARPALIFEATTDQRWVTTPPSLIGAVTAALPEEEWPVFAGEPLRALLQLNLSELPFRPKGLMDVEFLTLFGDPKRLPEEKDNASNWCLRTYKRLSSLKTLVDPREGAQQKPKRLGQPHLVEDFPARQDPEASLDKELWRQFKVQHPTQGGIKLGGWPSLPLEDSFRQHPAAPRFVFQVDGSALFAGKSSIALGLGTRPGMRDKWVMQWQVPVES